MAQHTLVSLDRLAEGLVLTPERYDPRRQASAGAVTVRDVAVTVRDLVGPGGSEKMERCLVLDTGDARDGFVQAGKAVVAQTDIGSTKKRTRPGDVLISRLRPYLRQVAYVDGGLADSDTAIVCSTEFFVLRGPSDRGIAFLVPFLLSEPVQSVLRLSQEGGHYPRVTEAALLGLTLPGKVDAIRDEISRAVADAAEKARWANQQVRALAERFGE